MAYVQHTSWRDRPGAIAAVIGIHGLIGYGLVTGMRFEQIAQVFPNPAATNIVQRIPLPPPPPPEIEPSPAPREPKPSASRIERPVVTPLPPLDLSSQRPLVDATPVIPDIADLVPRPLPSATPAVKPTPTPSARFSAANARPRNDPGSWVTEADYRSSWINREMIGTARFKLVIAASGRVESCTVTGSSGFPELDQATCNLVTRRARFDPAKDTNGEAATGTYTGSVRWQLPE